MAEIRSFDSFDALTKAALEYLLDAEYEAIETRGQFTLALSGGTTPRLLYMRMAEEPRFDWQRTHLFWSDERCVPPDDPQSNYRLAHEALLSKIAIPTGHVHRMKGELLPAQGADEYEADLKAFFGEERARFDLILLGLGDDGHTASLFPGTAALKEEDRRVVANYVPRLDSWRLTLTYPLLNAARRVAFLVSGAGKRQILDDVLEGVYVPDLLPAQGVEPADGALVWFIHPAE